MADKKVLQSDNIAYMRSMGAKVDRHIVESGVSTPLSQVQRYLLQLENYTIQRARWECPLISPREIARIEYLLFRAGYCAIVRPKRRLGRLIIKSNRLYVFSCAVSQFDYRTGEPLQITLTQTSDIETVYNRDDFVFVNISPSYAYGGTSGLSGNWSFLGSPLYASAYEAANKLYETDLMFASNSQKIRLPSIVATQKRHRAQGGRDVSVPAPQGVDASPMEAILSALQENLSLAEVGSDRVPETGLYHSTPQVSLLAEELFQARQKIYREYFELLGYDSLEERSGVYVAEGRGNSGFDTPTLIMAAYLAPRLMAANEVKARFGVDCSVKMFPMP